jgi:hypothetical protein
VAKLACLLILAVIAVGCGSSAAKPTGPATPGPGQVVYQGSEWAVVIDGGKATAEHLVGEAWQTAVQGTVKIDVLGPKPGSKGNAGTPQVAAALSAGGELSESAPRPPRSRRAGTPRSRTPARRRTRLRLPGRSRSRFRRCLRRRP